MRRVVERKARAELSVPETKYEESHSDTLLVLRCILLMRAVRKKVSKAVGG